MLCVPSEYKEHLTEGEIVAAIQISSNFTHLQEEIDESPPKLPLSPAQVEELTQENTRRNSIIQCTDPADSTMMRISRIARESIALVGMRPSFDINKVAEDNIARRVVQWNPIVTYAECLHDGDEEVSLGVEEKQLTPLPPLHQSLRNSKLKGILKHPPRSLSPPPSRPSPFIGKNLQLSLSSDDAIEDTLNPLFPETRAPSPPNENKETFDDKVAGWRKRKETYEVYRAKTPNRSVLSTTRREKSSFVKENLPFEKLDDVNVAPSKTRRHSHHVVQRSIPDENPTLLQATLRRNQRSSHGNDASRNMMRPSKQTKRYYSPPPARYDDRGNRIIELEELESPHHPIWVGVEERDWIGYQLELQDKNSEGTRCGLSIHHIGREEEKLIGGRFKDIV